MSSIAPSSPEARRKADASLRMSIGECARTKGTINSELSRRKVESLQLKRKLRSKRAAAGPGNDRREQTKLDSYQLINTQVNHFINQSLTLHLTLTRNYKAFILRQLELLYGYFLF